MEFRAILSQQEQGIYLFNLGIGSDVASPALAFSVSHSSRTLFSSAIVSRAAIINSLKLAEISVKPEISNKKHFNSHFPAILNNFSLFPQLLNMYVLWSSIMQTIRTQIRMLIRVAKLHLYGVDIFYILVLREYWGSEGKQNTA